MANRCSDLKKEKEMATRFLKIEKVLEFCGNECPFFRREKGTYVCLKHKRFFEVDSKLFPEFCELSVLEMENILVEEDEELKDTIRLLSTDVSQIAKNYDRVAKANKEMRCSIGRKNSDLLASQTRIKDLEAVISRIKKETEMV